VGNSVAIILASVEIHEDILLDLEITLIDRMMIGGIRQ